MNTAISYGTECWLGELARNGWTLTVSESLRPGPAVHLRLLEDDFEPMTLRAPSRQVGILASKFGDSEGAGVFVPMPSEGEARLLLEHVEEEIACER